jgi:hypothetical protein
VKFLKLKEGTRNYKIFKILEDGDWHCKCEFGDLNYNNALYDLRHQFGYEIENNIDRNFCEKCKSQSQYRLKSTVPNSDKTSFARSKIPRWLRKRIKKTLNYKEAYTGRFFPYKTADLEIDHKIPNRRWEDLNWVEPKYEKSNPPTEKFIRETFQLLSNKHNGLKESDCKKCQENGKRQLPYGIKFFYSGTEKFEHCEGCGWYDLEKWREELNKLI